MRKAKLWGATAALALAFALSVPDAAIAQPAATPSDLCENASRSAAAEIGVPTDVLLAISLTETGRRMAGNLRPWPWAVNRDGQGYWFDSRAQARSFARQSLRDGQRSFDLGCFQINWRWHGEHFNSPDDLLDPGIAARYAARHLLALHQELGDWTRAAGAYHSRTPRHAERYRRRFAQIHAALRSQPAPPAPPAPSPPSYALLTGQSNGASLVPTSSPTPRPFIAIRP